MFVNNNRKLLIDSADQTIFDEALGGNYEVYKKLVWVQLELFILDSKMMNTSSNKIDAKTGNMKSIK